VHFSALDLGREINITPHSETQALDNVTFSIQLFVSPTPISLTSPLFKGLDEVFETKSGSNYYYFTKRETSLEKIRMILNSVQGAFPEALLKCYKNGKEISLKKGIKMNKK
jgi:phospholipid/cholesterol/gamma-HCH transport system substrate-binding protein